MNGTKSIGRPPGSNSFVSIRISELRKFFQDEAAVQVSKKWLELVGFTGKIEKIELQETRPHVGMVVDRGI